MKKLTSVSGLLAMLLLAIALPASATHISLTLESVGPYTFEGRAAFPFYFSNGMVLMPYDYKADNNKAVQKAIGLTWQATEIPIDNFKPGSYERAAAWLYLMDRREGGVDPNINGAVFWMFNHNSVTMSPAMQAWVDQADLHAWQKFPNLYLFLEAPHSGGMQMLGGVPEPSTLLLVGTALLGLAGLRKRFGH